MTTSPYDMDGLEEDEDGAVTRPAAARERRAYGQVDPRRGFTPSLTVSQAMKDADEAARAAARAAADVEVDASTGNGSGSSLVRPGQCPECPECPGCPECSPGRRLPGSGGSLLELVAGLSILGGVIWYGATSFTPNISDYIEGPQEEDPGIPELAAYASVAELAEDEPDEVLPALAADIEEG